MGALSPGVVVDRGAAGVAAADADEAPGPGPQCADPEALNITIQLQEWLDLKQELKEVREVVRWFTARSDIGKDGLRILVEPKHRWAQGWETDFPAYLEEYLHD